MDFSRCEDCAVGGPVTACAHPFDRNDDAQLLALASNGDELGVALVTGTSTELGYDGNTSVRLALLDASLSVKSGVAVPLPYATKLSLSATPDGWLLLVETLNYEGFDAPPNGVIQTLLSFDDAGQLRGTAAFHGRRDGFLVPRAGAEPLYAFATDRAEPTAWAQVLSYAGDGDVSPFVANTWFKTKSTLPACGTSDETGVLLFSRYERPDEEGYVSTLLLPAPGLIGGAAFRATAPGACAIDGALGVLYQARSPDDESLATFLRYPAASESAFHARDPGPIAAYRVAGFNAGPRALVLRAPLSDAGPTDLQVWDTRVVASYVATTVAHGPHVPSYDIVRFGDDAIAGWIAEPPGKTGFGRIALARMRPEAP